MSATKVSFQLEITDANVFARFCEEIGDDETLEELYSNPDSGVTPENILQSLEMFRNSFAGQLARFLSMGSTMRSGGISMRTGNLASAEFSCAEAAERVVQEVRRGCPPGLELIDVSNEK